MCLCVPAHESVVMEARATGRHCGAGDIHGWEPLDMGAGNWTQSSAVCVGSHRAISPVAIPQSPYLNNVPGFAFPAKLFRYVIINTTLALKMII